MPTNPTWEDTVEVGSAPSWDDTAPVEEPPKDFRRDELAKQMFQARLEGEQGKLYSGLADVGTELSKGVVRAASHVDPTGFTHGLMEQYGVDPTHVISPEAAHRGAEIASELAGEGLRKIGITHDIIPKQVQKPIQEFAAENVAALPEMLPALALGAFGVNQAAPVGRLFQAQMLQGVPQSAYQSATAETPEERLKAGLGAAAGLAFPAAIEMGLRPKAQVVPDFTGRALERPQGALPPAGEPTAPLERVTPEQSALAAERMSEPFEEKPPTEPPVLAPEKTEGGSGGEVKPKELVLWGFKPGTSEMPVKLSKSSRKSREREGWILAEYAKGDEPTGLILQAKEGQPKFEMITPADDTHIGKNDAGEDLYERENGQVYRMRHDRPKDKPYGYPDFGGDLAPTLEESPVLPTPDSSYSSSEQRGKGNLSSEIVKPVPPEPPLAKVEGGPVVETSATPAEVAKVAEEGPKAAFSRDEIQVGKPSTSRRTRPNGVYGEVRIEVNAPSKVTSPEIWTTISDTSKLRAVVEGRLDFSTGKSPKKTDPKWTVWGGNRNKPELIAQGLTYEQAINAAKNHVESSIKPESSNRLQVLTDKLESGQKLTASEVKQYKKLRDGATGAKPETAQPEVETGEQGALSTPPIVPSTPAPTPANVPVKAVSQIIRDLSKGLNIPIRFGRLTTSKYAGYFKKIPNLIGARRANDLPVVSHEVGHKLDALYNISRDPALAAELDLLGDPSRLGPGSSWTPSKSHSYKLGEGVAEFIRQWIDDPTVPAKHSPNMTRFFESLLASNNDMARVLKQAQENVQLWKNAPPLERLDSSIVRGEGPVKARYGLSNLTRDLVDDLHFLKLATEEAKKTTDIPASQNPYILARLLRGTFGMADSFIRRGVVDFKTKEVRMGTGLEDILKPVSGRINDFRRFIVAKRAKELMDRGKQTGLQAGDVAEALRTYQGAPEFQATFDKLKAWNDSLLQYSLDAGMLKPETVRAMRELNEDYVPFHRFFEIGANELNAEQGSGVGRGLNVGTPGSLRRLKGSNRDIVDPLETMVRNAYAIITASEKNAINTALADLAEKPNMGKWVERVKTPIDPHKVTMEDIRKKLEAMGADVSMIPDDAEFTFFRRSGKTPYGENIIKVVRDGNAEYYRVNGDLYETFHALDYDLAGKFIRLFSQPSQLLRAGVTLSPDFSVKNAVRDTISSAVISKYSMVPFLHTAKGVFNLLGGDKKMVAEWAAAGGKQSVEATYFDAAKIQKFLSEKITKEMTPAQRAKMYIMSPLMALRRLSGLFEEGTRLGQYEVAYKKLRSEGVAEGDARRMAAFEARDLQDFAKGGANTKPLRMLAAFWNAALQGNVRLAQAFKERPIATTAKGLAYITLPKLMEQAINWNDDDYWDRPQWERDLFFLFPFGKDENNRTKFIRVPVPFEVGVMFASLPGRITQWMKENRPDAMTGFPELMLKQTVPNPIPQWLLTLFEVNAGKQGYSMWRGRPIVPTSVADKAEELQFTEQNSLTAQKVGKALGVSPAKVDYAIQGTTGGLGKMATHQISDRVIQAITGEKPTAQNVTPGGSFFTTPAGAQSDAVERFYRALDDARKDMSLAKAGKPTKGDYKYATFLESSSKRFGELRNKARKTIDPLERQRISLEIAKEAKSALDRIKQTQGK